MFRRLLRFLLLALVVFQAPAVRACNLEAMLTGESCDGRADHAADAALVHCHDAMRVVADAHERPVCQTCQVKSVVVERAERVSVPPRDALPAPLVGMPRSTGDATGSSVAFILPRRTTAPAVARVLPLLI